MTAVQVNGTRARVEFDRFDLTNYELFLRAKQLPESDLAYDWRSDRYTLTTPARFASRLDGSLVAPAVAEAKVADHLFDYQRWIVGMAFDARRFAIWADTGLGKTAMFLEWARLVSASTVGRVLIISPLQIIEQTREEWQRFYCYEPPLLRLETRADVVAWCTGNDEGIAITNPEKLTAGDLPELRYLAGLVLDESSLLKTGGGTIKWNLIHSAKGIEYKLSCTATPAPNDTMEYASQAAFLEKLRTEGDILWTYFSRDKYGTWRVKPHAREAFYRFMASWSIYLRDPAHYGFADILSTLPPPEVHEYVLPLTDEQKARMTALQVETGAGMFNDKLGVRERSKFSQLAKGFLYVDGGSERIASAKPAAVADLVAGEVSMGRQTIVWTVFDEESDIIGHLLAERASVGFATLHGADSPEARQATIAAFKRGDVPVLVTKAALVGYGLNLQNAQAQVFSGFDDSFERMYQAIRRSYRFGQTHTVHVHVPYIPELEGLIFENVRGKEAAFMRDVAIQEANYRAALEMSQ